MGMSPKHALSSDQRTLNHEKVRFESKFWSTSHSQFESTPDRITHLLKRVHFTYSVYFTLAISFTQSFEVDLSICLAKPDVDE
jgi:hypothetical protein